ncbi:UNVERIFIED_CONTAM: hypothetical protein HDU68_012755 [Siphonaria sp. JEL0065]|nr:hypothetical protein HDU68_012755 [Siphonaria sp. JEL0065]
MPQHSHTVRKIGTANSTIKRPIVSQPSTVHIQVNGFDPHQPNFNQSSAISSLCNAMTAFTFRAPLDGPIRQEKSIFQQETPREIVQQIFSLIPPVHVLKFRRLCKYMNEYLLDPHFALINLKYWIPSAFNHHSKKRTFESVRGDGDCQFDHLWFILPESYQVVYAKHALKQTSQISFFSFFPWTANLRKVVEYRIPPAIQHVESLEHLGLSSARLDNNNNDSALVRVFVGPIPAEIGGLKSLTHLQLTKGRLEGRIPVEVCDLVHLTMLDLSANWLSGEIPCEIGRLKALTLLNLSENGFTGLIPQEIGTLANLTELNLSNNKLSGSLPIEMFGLIALESLNLEENELNGNVPCEIKWLVSLDKLDISNNQFSGQFPDIFDRVPITDLNISHNEFTGPVKNLIQRKNKLLKLAAGSNQFSGLLPTSGWNKAMTKLDISDNQISGVIPKEVFQLKHLKSLYVGGNELGGPVLDIFVGKIQKGIVGSDLLILEGFTRVNKI